MVSFKTQRVQKIYQWLFTNESNWLSQCNGLVWNVQYLPTPLWFSTNLTTSSAVVFISRLILYQKRDNKSLKRFVCQMREKGVSILSSKRTEDLCETGVTTEISTCVRLSMGLPTTWDMVMWWWWWWCDDGDGDDDGDNVSVDGYCLVHLFEMMKQKMVDI